MVSRLAHFRLRLIRAARSERGLTLMELLIAMVISSVGIAATVGVFGASDRTTLSAQRSGVGAQQAQLELDRLTKLEYGELSMTSTPAHSNDTKNPNYRVNGTTFTTAAGAEEMVLVAEGGDTPQVDPGPQTFTVGSGNSAVTGKIYRYVTWRDETCPAGVCDTTQDSKRLTVAVTIDPVGSATPRPPLWFSTVMGDPAASPGVLSGSGDIEEEDDSSAQSFYLYDTPCKEHDRKTITASHATRMTSGLDANKDKTSTCENGDTMEEPDLMDTDGVGSGSPTLYSYSNDLTGTYPGGLAMMRNGSSCVTSHSFVNAANPSVPNKWGVHTWASNKVVDPPGTVGSLVNPFNLTGKVTMSLYTQTLGGAAGRGVLCMTLIDRYVHDGLPSDIVLGTATHDLASWPTTPTEINFGFTMAADYNLVKDHRLVVVLHLLGTSTTDIALLYSHPDYPSQLEIHTLTPVL